VSGGRLERAVAAGFETGAAAAAAAAMAMVVAEPSAVTAAVKAAAAAAAAWELSARDLISLVYTLWP